MKSEASTAVSRRSDNSDRKPGPSSDDVLTQALPRKKSIGSSGKRKGKSSQSESASSNGKNASESSDSDGRPGEDNNSIDQSFAQQKTKLAGKSGTRKNKNKRAAERVLVAMQKRQKKMMASDADSVFSGSRDMKLRSRSRKEDEDISSSSQKKVSASADERLKKMGSSKSLNCEVLSDSVNKAAKDQSIGNPDEASRKDELVDESPGKQEVCNDKSWKTLEKALYEKGLEIFGKNRYIRFHPTPSCLFRIEHELCKHTSLYHVVEMLLMLGTHGWGGLPLFFFLNSSNSGVFTAKHFFWGGWE